MWWTMALIQLYVDLILALCEPFVRAAKSRMALDEHVPMRVASQSPQRDA